MQTLIVVESPTKAATLKKFLGKEYEVQSSLGHVRDLPKGNIGIDVEHDFTPSYVIPTKARKTVTILKNQAKKAEETILAADEDREGEAIAWHIAQVLDLKDPKRIVFHEITKEAIVEALKHPRTIDMNRVNAQQARRILDRLVGYKLSPFLWKKVARGLSAGRVQSVAVRLIADREREIQAFKPQEYWSVEALLQQRRTTQKQTQNDAETFIAILVKKDAKPIGKLDITSKEEADAILKDLKGAEYKVVGLEQKDVKRNPLPPFTTSTLQQTSWQRLRFPAKLTMQLAQQLYEQGLITYHRTDSLNLSELSLNAAKLAIQKTYGANFWAQRRYKTKSKGAQEAHEAIRPTYPDKTSESSGLTGPKARMYELIWSRFLASQMAPALVASTAVDITAKNYIFRATGQMLKFEGFLKVYPIKFIETELPPLEQSEIVHLKSLNPFQHFTEPPPRYTEATLVKALEEHGIGRPSTYAPILSTIQERGYIEKDEQKRLKPTELGSTVNDVLVNHFPEIVDIDFTAGMEEKLDNIAGGKTQWVPMLRSFYKPFEENLEKKYQEVAKKDIAQETTDKTCPQCGSPLVIRLGRYGKFYACSTFPKCKYTESLETKNAPIGMACPKCNKGEVVAKKTRRGKMFYGCNRYPECDFASWQKPKNEVE